MTENCIYIKDGFNKYGNYEKMDYIQLILNRDKPGETRNHNRLARGWIGIGKGNFVYGRVKLGDPYLITTDSPEYKSAFIFGTKYDIKPGETKYYYPILETEDFRANPKPIIRHGNYGLYELNNR